MIQITNSHVAVLRKKDFQSKQHKDFDEVKHQVIGKIKREQGAEAAKLAAQEVLAKAQEGEEFAGLLEPLEITWHEPAPIKRTGSAAPRELVQEVYEAKHPKGSVIYGETEVNGGDYALYMLTEVTTAESSDGTDALKERLASNQGRSQYVSLVSEWRESADIVTYPDKLDQ